MLTVADRMVATFLEVYKPALGIEGYSLKFGREIRGVEEISDFMTECFKNPNLQEEIKECYIKSAQTSVYLEALQFIKDFFETSLKKVSKQDLISIMKEAFIE